jgi:hypothetical protein
MSFLIQALRENAFVMVSVLASVVILSWPVAVLSDGKTLLFRCVFLFSGWLVSIVVCSLIVWANRDRKIDEPSSVPSRPSSKRLRRPS